MSYKKKAKGKGSINLNPSSLLLNLSPEEQDSIERDREEIKDAAVDKLDDVGSQLSCCNQTTRLIVSGPSNLLKRCLVNLAIYRSNLSYNWFRGRSPTILVDRHYLKRVVLIHAFFDGMDKVTKTFWPMACISLLVYDYTQFNQSPQLRYQNHWYDIVLGLSPNNDANHGALLSHMGSDIPSELEYWAGYIAVFGSTFTMGMMNLIWRAKRFHIKAHMYGIPHLNEDNNHRIGKSKMTHHMLGYLLDDEMPDEARQPTVQQLQDMSDTGSITRRKRALNALGNIVDSFSSSNHRKRKQEAMEAERALEAVANASILNRNPLDTFSYMYAHYQLWSIGRHSSKRAHVIFHTTVTLPQLFFLYHLWRLFFMKITGFVKFKMAENSCHQDDKFWRLINEIGNYACVTCTSHLVDYPNAQSGQGCLTQSLQVQQEADTLASFLNDFSNHGPFTSLDLSHQTWWHWQASQWQSIVEQLDDYPDELFNIVNLSTPRQSTQVVPYAVIQQMSSMFRSRSIGVVDLQHQFLGDEGLAILLNALDPTRIEHLNLTDCGLTDAGMFTLADWLFANPNATDNRTTLQTLRLGHNNFTSYGLAPLFDALVDSDVTDLDLSGNLLSPQSLSIISDTIDLTSLVRINLSDNDLSQANITQLGQALVKARQLDALLMNHCNLGDTNVMILSPYVSNSSLIKLDWSNNQIGSMGTQALSSAIAKSGVIELSLSGNLLDDYALSILVETLNVSCIQRLNIGNNPITSPGFSKLLKQLSHSPHNISSLYVDNSIIGDFSATTPTHWLTQSRLQQLSLRNTGLSNDDMTQLSGDLPNSSLTHLWLGNNRLADTFSELAASVAISSLRFLDISQAQINTPLFNTFIALLPYSQLERIHMDNNYFSSANGVMLAQTLINPFSQETDLATMPYRNRDFFRALHRTGTNTALQQLQIAHNQLDSKGIHALCLALPRTHITVNMFNVRANPWNADEIHVPGCPVNTSTLSNNHTNRFAIVKHAAHNSLEEDGIHETLSAATSSGIVLLMLMAVTATANLIKRTSIIRLASGLCGRLSGSHRSNSPTRSASSGSSRFFSNHQYPSVSIDSTQLNEADDSYILHIN